ncbi:ADAMTS-like protein 5 [Molothrus aeneus]|uniref:ADAMTS-like protein 5 n=1 Tax=Molothrus aeneus TaxID=84833 RepID=UPI003458AB22
MAGGGRGGGSDPRGGPHGSLLRRSWRLLLLAWLSLVGTAQDPALGTLVRVPEPPAPARPRGTWGSWGPWSSCSSSCGDGVALRSRRCLRTSEEQPCPGDSRQYRLCQLQGCPAGSVPFRAMQCSLYDNRPVLGTSARYRWVPFHGAPNLCDLNCLAEGHNFYYSFGRVLDGTRCSPGSPDLCVGGRCLSVGCDGILGSGPDACGHCGSGHGSCVLVHRLFQGSDPSSGYLGYVNVTKIPAGATHIKVTDKSRNYLALMASDGRYVLNGDWAIAWPGPYEAAGTLLTYSRAPDGTESLEAPGPTHEDLHVMVLLQEPNPGIEYQFWLPRGHPQLGRGDTSPLRQPQPRGAGSPPPPEPPEPPLSPAPAPPPRPRGLATEPPPRSPPDRSQDGAAAGRCGKCRPPKGRSQRIRHFCQSDFVFHGRILARRVVGRETRYEVAVEARYRQRFPLVSREYLWVPNTCGCPPLLEGGEYLLMARRHVNHEHTLNRILLQHDGYARPWTPREARLVRGAAQHCPHPRPP